MIALLAQLLWQSPDRTGAVVGVLAVLLVGVLWLYPSQTRIVSPGWRWIMPALRGMALAALVVAVLRPAVLRPRTAARQGPLGLLVDRSHSMSAVDRDRTPAELVALSAGLNALPSNIRSEVAPGLRGQLDAVRSLLDQLDRARSEAEYARLSGRSVPAATARLRDAGEQLRDALAALPQLPPALADLQTKLAAMKQSPPVIDEPTGRALRAALNAAVAALALAQAQADEKLFQDDANVRAICTSVGSRSRRRLVEAGLSQAGGLLGNASSGTPIVAFTFADEIRPLNGIGMDVPLDLEPSGSETDIAGALRASLTRLTPRGPQAIVLLSDGRQVGGDAEGILSDVSSAGVPIFTVLTAAAGQRKDVSIVRVDSPSSARVGQSIRVHVELRGAAFSASAVDVRLDAGSVRQIKRVVIAEDGSASVDFDVALVRPGPAALVVNVTPLAGESSDQNNRFEKWIKVGAESARMLVIAGADAGRQYASLHAAMSRAPWVALREVEDDEVATLSPRSIAEQDVIVLCDIGPYEMNDAQWSAIEQVVRERGGSVIVCSGRRSPMEYVSHRHAAMLLPFEPGSPITWRSWPGEEPRFRVVPTSALEAPSSEMEFWRQLPPVSRYVASTRLRSDARSLLVERESGSAVLTETRRGLGRLYFIGTDQTWRWRGQAGGEERDRFWPQLVRLAVGEPYAAVEGNVRLDVDQIAPQPDRSFGVRARVLDSFSQPTDSTSQTLHILQDGNEIRQVSMTSLSDGSGLYRGTVSGLPAGEYTLRLDAPDDPSLEVPLDPVELDISVAPRLENELSNLSGDDQFLRRLADASGGQFLTLEELSSLPQRLADNRQKQSALVEYTLWDSPYLFGFVLACLSAEWAMRKRFGLA